MAKATAFSVCDLCGERHARGAPHVWKTITPSVHEILEETSQKYTKTLKRLAAGPDPKPVSATHGPLLPNIARGGVLIAPPGQCEWCDARRAYTADQMRKSRKKEPTP